MTQVIAVFGLSGVGKSTTVQRVVTASGGAAAAVNAGDLIRQRLRDQRSTEMLRFLPAEQIQRNQEFLIEELASVRTTVSAPVLLLDGHCVIDNGEQLVPIPIKVIKRLDLAALVFVQGEAVDIRARRLADGGRSRPILSSAELAKQQKCALAVCASYASGLGLRLTVVTAEQWRSVMRVIEEATAKNGRHVGNPMRADLFNEND